MKGLSTALQSVYRENAIKKSLCSTPNRNCGESRLDAGQLDKWTRFLKALILKLIQLFSFLLAALGVQSLSQNVWDFHFQVEKWNLKSIRKIIIAVIACTLEPVLWKQIRNLPLKPHRLRKVQQSSRIRSRCIQASKMRLEDTRRRRRLSSQVLSQIPSKLIPRWHLVNVLPMAPFTEKLNLLFDMVFISNPFYWVHPNHFLQIGLKIYQPASTNRMTKHLQQRGTLEQSARMCRMLGSLKQTTGMPNRKYTLPFVRYGDQNGLTLQAFRPISTIYLCDCTVLPEYFSLFIGCPHFWFHYTCK